MSVKDIFKRTADVLTADRVFAPPHTVDGVTVIAAASVRGGGGGGGGGDAEQSGEGGGFGVIARPVGVFVIDEGRVRWRPVIDVGRIVLGCQVVAVVCLWLRWRIEHARILVVSEPD